ncbi:enteropeptidase-like [Sabethes cyaneus]|uniref:enteropeptidase-like n=1 Tax=Sabethes cyaneus TaxID=53552 RepID=UPI00237EA622|nr:enteropeptidase-like [Sabethes cyaneus]
MKNSFIITLSAVLVTVSCANKVLSKCGIPKIAGKELITNGQATDPGDWPWHAAIFHSNGPSTEYVCGGTIISEEFIVTAAHCVMNAKNGFPLAPSRITVRLGIHDLLEINPAFVQQHKVEKVFKFENFTRLVDDIALIKLSTIIRFTDYVQPACMNVEPDIIGRYGTVVGWGLTESDETSPILKKVDIPVIDPVACLKTDRVLFGQTINDGLFCAGYTNGTGVCNGDSGGGLFFPRGNRWFLGGIVSFSQARSAGSNKCYMKGYGAFTKVQHYITWISEITGMNFQRNTKVRLGEHTLNQYYDCNDGGEDCAPPVQDYNVECITIHSGFNSGVFTDDIALLRLTEDVHFEGHIQPICLPHTRYLRSYQPPYYVTSGWDKSWELEKATVTSTNSSDCYKYSNTVEQIPDRRLCVNNYSNDTCIGDSGAPLGYAVDLYGTQFVQFGIRGWYCGLKVTPVTKVAYYMDWIIANMKP